MNNVPAREQRVPVGAAIFDVDGVLVASPHERAWREALAALMAGEWQALAPTTTYAPDRFTTAVYQAHLAGKPRLDGATAALEFFDVPDPAQRAIAYAERKQAVLDELIARGEFEAFADALRLVQALRERRVCLGVASSSKNADRFMERITLDDGQTLREVFDANVCGRDLPHGKPNPEIFLVTARELGVAPARCIVVEDAASGIQAARAAGMMALGVARLDDSALLEAAGANLVVTSLDLVSVDAFVDGHLERDREQSPVGARGD